MTPFEILTRNIGDILYMLHDYEAAFDFYRHSAEAFKVQNISKLLVFNYCFWLKLLLF